MQRLHRTIRTLNFVIGSEPVKLNIQSWSGFVGQWDNRQWKQTEVKLQPRTPPPDIPADVAALLQRPRTRRDPYGEMKRNHSGFYQARASSMVCIAPAHGWPGVNEAYAYSYLFAYTIDVPANAKTLTLPQNDYVRILAITGSNEGSSVKPARPLYDTLDR